MAATLGNSQEHNVTEILMRAIRATSSDQNVEYKHGFGIVVRRSFMVVWVLRGRKNLQGSLGRYRIGTDQNMRLEWKTTLGQRPLARLMFRLGLFIYVAAGQSHSVQEPLGGEVALFQDESQNDHPSLRRPALMPSSV